MFSMQWFSSRGSENKTGQKKQKQKNPTEKSLTITEVYKMIVKLSFQIIFSIYPYLSLQNGHLNEINLNENLHSDPFGGFQADLFISIELCYVI